MNMDTTAQRRLNEEAAGWLLTLQDAPTSESETAFRAWLIRSADHMQAFLEISAVDRDLDGVDKNRRIDMEALVAGINARSGANVVTMDTEASAPDTGGPAGRSGWLRNHWRPAAAAAAGVLGVALWLGMTAGEHYSTAVGEQRTLKLEDGSMVQLNVRSRLQVKFTDASRTVRLMEGEALFTVEQDGKRPFRVLTDAGDVQVLGTQFNVYLKNSAATVSVLEGRVKVSDEELGAGDQARIDDGRLTRNPDADVLKAIAWRQRQLDFTRTPLAEAIAEFNRYNALEISIADPQLGSRELEGVFNADEPQALLDFLAQEPGLRVERQGKTVLIRRR